MDFEVERKFFFLKDAWDVQATEERSLDQGYLSDTGAWEIRLRRGGGDFRYTMKQGGGLRRAEWEVRLAKADFEALWPLTLGQRVSKTRSRYTWKGTEVMVDAYGEKLSGLTVAEVEFSSVGQARRFRPPAAFGPELTYDPRFKNRALAAGVTVPLLPPGEGTQDWSFGVLPFRKTPRGWELVLVTTRRRDRWIVPKGQPEPRATFLEVARLEASEEAGLLGSAAGHPLTFPYTRETGTTNLLLFPFRVTSVASKWREQEERERKFVPLEEAAEHGPLAELGAAWIANHFGPSAR